MAALIAVTAAYPGLGAKAALPDMNTTDPFEAFKASQASMVKRTRAVQLERHAVVPLHVGHLEQIDLRHSAGDVEQRIDSAKAFEGSFDDALR